MSDSNKTESPSHVGLLPSSGMGHLMPFIRLAASLATHNCRITLITTHDPTVSLAESQLISRFLSAFPQVTSKHFHLLPLDSSTANSTDPFYLQMESIRRSAHLLYPILSSSTPPLSALITDISLASSLLPITTNLGLSNYLLFTSCAKMLSLYAYFTSIDISSVDEINIPGSDPIPKSWIPPLLLNPTDLFSIQFIENGQMIVKSDGVLVNTCDSLEKDTLASLNEVKVVTGFPPVFSIGPLAPCAFELTAGLTLSWLDDQPVGSVVYVSFGSRTAISSEQIKELGDGLVKSGCRFLWVVKSNKVDREDKEEGVEVVFGNGLVVKTWVDQGEILSHPAVGGFLSHCGWNSVTEAAWNGVPILAWPQGADQKINAAKIVEKNGFGKWVKSWGWGGQALVMAEEIGERVRILMEDEGLKVKAGHIREETRKAAGSGGSSKDQLITLTKRWKTYKPCI